MKCPKCSVGKVKVTHTYGTDFGFTQRCVCEGCGAVLVTKATIIKIDPTYGEGASAIARKMREKQVGSDEAPDLPEEREI
jgi:transcription initiation factor TFIIIB Brf1 subunit/transcription initiation factor TFIIB